jgi:hypothetical protein
LVCSNTHIEEEICRLRAELLRKDQDNERMQLQLVAEKEERERVQVGGWVGGWLGGFLRGGWLAGRGISWAAGWMAGRGWLLVLRQV